MATHLKEGEKAPAFSTKDSEGNKVGLKDFKDQWLLLYFYPEDDTPTCTIQSCNLRDNYAELLKEGIRVIGVSPNDEASHEKFRAKFSLPFPLLPDPQHKIIDLYGAWGEKNLYGRKYMGLHRTSFLIDGKGIIRKIFLKPMNKAHGEQVLKETRNKKQETSTY